MISKASCTLFCLVGERVEECVGEWMWATTRIVARQTPKPPPRAQRHIAASEIIPESTPSLRQRARARAVNQASGSGSGAWANKRQTGSRLSSRGSCGLGLDGPAFILHQTQEAKASCGLFLKYFQNKTILWIDFRLYRGGTVFLPAKVNHLFFLQIPVPNPINTL